ncbi:PQQ-dependent sugar dehydrogenase [Pontibacter cellulosilyticus]|uniref:PQQ-dependent sugar dehydrogenase n=1 Tax=Pontibacter cellulosilyticus TaxID=1720253 RepID=A0A923SJU6_9BACT|nr:PQQ-dependent sugar dehydrogenase [Pontibacter cellulosilyticus]MBC5994269.1 PQQ-dependent sugar dehydrogenase [Pontibacter cellulosilyticus]
MMYLYKVWGKTASLFNLHCALTYFKSSRTYTLFRSSFLIICFALCGRISFAQPSGFVEEQIGDNWEAAVGLAFSKDGNSMYVWEKAGKVWIVENGQKLPTPLIDISQEVGNWGDHGLLGFALDPNFESNGHFYLLYVVDRHHLMNFGKGSYNPTTNEYFDATIGRLTRYTAPNKKVADLSTRKILLGETLSTGVPVLYESHGIGSLIFGEDGSLLVSTGDGATAGWLDRGYDPSQPNDTYVPQALQDGIITAGEDVGAYKAQQIQSLNGKILRIDPNTGSGLPSNPFYNSSNPNAHQSKVWALGLRNPFRFTLRPGTGSADFPGVLYVGDSGWQDWEEVNVVTKKGMNFGWPMYEGLEGQLYYLNTGTANPLAPNPLYGQGNCTQQFINFQFLLVQPKKTEAPYFGNPCKWDTPIPSSIPTFVHSRPAIDWVNDIVKDGVEPAANARTGSFDGENPVAVKIGSAGSPVTGPQFYGSSSTGGVWYTGDDFPAEYKNTYFFGDYGAGWIRNASFNTSDDPTAVRNFINSNANVVAITTNPVTGGLYYINYATQIKKVSYYSGNTPPKAVAEADKLFGTSPLTIQFSSAKSTDAEGQALTYEWDFGDGSAKSTAANPTHTFNATQVGQQFTVTLKVTDAGGLSSTATLKVSVNNTPPVVNITSPAEGTKYPLADKTVYNLRATVTDNEHNDSQLTYEWQTVLHHNTHIHPEPIDNKKETTTTITPIGCDSEIYFYRINLKVTDAGGLSSTDYVDLYPDCNGTVVKSVNLSSPANNSTFALGAQIPLKVSFADASRVWNKVEYYQGSSLIGTVYTSPYDYSWTGASAGSYSITAKAYDNEGHVETSNPISITVGSSAQVDLPNCLPGVVHYFGLDSEGTNQHRDFASSATASCATCPQNTAGKFNGAQQFSNTSTGLNIANVANFNWNKDVNFTISFWMKSSTQSSTNSVIIGRNAVNSRMHWWVGLNPQGQAMFMLKDVDHTGIYLGNRGPSLTDGQWHQVTAIRDGSNQKSKLYVDGVLLEEVDYFYTKGFEGQAPVNVGYMQLDHGYHYAGALDELKVYNRALLADEVASTYNSGNGSYCGSNALGLDDEENFAGTFEIYPNPNNGVMGVYVTDLMPGEAIRLTLTDMTGRKVFSKEVVATSKGVVQVKLNSDAGISSGLYNLVLTSPDRSISRKVVIVKQ